MTEAEATIGPVVRWRRVRFPCLGLLLAALAGIVLADRCPELWPGWLTLAALFVAAACFWQRSLLVAGAVLAFFGFWHGLRICDDPGRLFAEAPDVEAHVHIIRCRVVAEPVPSRSWQGRQHGRFTGDVLQVDGGEARLRALFQLPSADFHAGDVLELSGRFSRPERARNPGEVDWREYYARRRVYLRFTAQGGLPELISRPAASVTGGLRSVRRWFDASLTRGVEDDPEVCALLRGIMFGDRTGMSPELLDLLDRTGTLHLFVVDGLKVALVAGLSWACVRVGGLGRRGGAAALGFCLFGYGLLTGWTASGLRAGGMCLLAVFGVSLERPLPALNALGAVGFVLLLAEPQQAFEVGFQLSFLVVGAVLVAVRPLSAWLVQPFQPDPFLPAGLVQPAQRAWNRFGHHLCELVAVSVVCWAASLPIAIEVFHRVSLGGILYNVLVVPLGSLMLLTGAASLALGVVWSVLGGCLNNFNWLLAQLFLTILRTTYALPCDALNVSSARAAPLECTLLAVGRTPVFHVRDGFHDALLNVGTPSRWRGTVAPYLRRCGINQLGAIFYHGVTPPNPVWLAGALHDFQVGTPLAGRGAEAVSAVEHLGPDATLERVDPATAGRRGRSGDLGPLVFCLRGFRVGWYPASAVAALPKAPGPLDVLVVTRARTAGARRLTALTGARLVVSLEGDEVMPPPGDLGPPVWFAKRTGGLRFCPGEDRLQVTGWCAGSLELPRRN